jgi:hypothetical protein
MKVESRYPLVGDPAKLERITAEIRGKVPSSPHALCDEFDKRAAVVARDRGLLIVACAGEPYEGSVEVSEERQVVKDAPPNEPPVKPGRRAARGAPPEVAKPTQTTVLEKVMVQVPTLSRDFWCVKAPDAA